MRAAARSGRDNARPPVRFLRVSADERRVLVVVFLTQARHELRFVVSVYGRLGCWNWTRRDATKRSVSTGARLDSPPYQILVV